MLYQLNYPTTILRDLSSTKGFVISSRDLWLIYQICQSISNLIIIFWRYLGVMSTIQYARDRIDFSSIVTRQSLARVIWSIEGQTCNMLELQLYFMNWYITRLHWEDTERKKEAACLEDGMLNDSYRGNAYSSLQTFSKYHPFRQRVNSILANNVT